MLFLSATKREDRGRPDPFSRRDLLAADHRAEYFALCIGRDRSGGGAYAFLSLKRPFQDQHRQA